MDLSINAALNTTKITQAAPVQKKAVTIRETPVTEDKVFEAWIRFPSQIRELSRLHFIFSKQPLWEPETMSITTEVPGELLAKQLQGIMDKLTSFIHNTLQNDLVKINVVVNEIKQEEIDSSPVGKAKAMANKNANLREFCRRLHLDFT